MTNVKFPVIDLVASGRNIKRLRKANHLSVPEMKEYFNFSSTQAIYKWQKGQSLPTTDNLVALSVLFNTPMEDILILGFYKLTKKHGVAG